MSSQFSVDPDVALAGFKAVGGADVVQASAGHVVPRRGVRTGHDPGRAQGNSVHLSDRVTNIQLPSAIEKTYISSRTVKCWFNVFRLIW